MIETPQERLVVFCQDVVPTVLREACNVEDSLAESIGADIYRRAGAFADSDLHTRRVLTAPFIEDVVDFEPVEAPLDLRAATAVVLRNSLLEQAHANGDVNDGGIKVLTTLGARALSAYLRIDQRQLVARLARTASLIFPTPSPGHGLPCRHYRLRCRRADGSAIDPQTALYPVGQMGPR